MQKSSSKRSLFSEDSTQESIDPKSDKFDAKDIFLSKEVPSTGVLAWVIVKLSIPEIVTGIMNWSCVLINGILAGQMDDPVNLAVVGLAASCSQIFIMYPIVTLGSG